MANLVAGTDIALSGSKFEPGQIYPGFHTPSGVTKSYPCDGRKIDLATDPALSVLPDSFGPVDNMYHSQLTAKSSTSTGKPKYQCLAFRNGEAYAYVIDSGSPLVVRELHYAKNSDTADHWKEVDYTDIYTENSGNYAAGICGSHDGQHLYILTYHNTNGYFYVVASHDYGATWTGLTLTPAMGTISSNLSNNYLKKGDISCSSDGVTVTALTGGANDIDLTKSWTSTDSGTNFTETRTPGAILTDPGSNLHFIEIAKNQNKCLMGCGHNSSNANQMYIAGDSNSTFTDITANMPHLPSITQYQKWAISDDGSTIITNVVDSSSWKGYYTTAPRLQFTTDDGATWIAFNTDFKKINPDNQDIVKIQGLKFDPQDNMKVFIWYFVRSTFDSAYTQKIALLDLTTYALTEVVPMLGYVTSTVFNTEWYLLQVAYDATNKTYHFVAGRSSSASGANEGYYAKVEYDKFLPYEPNHRIVAAV